MDIGLKAAKTDTEIAKARGIHSDSDNKDLDFVNKETGRNEYNKGQEMALTHQQTMEAKEHDRLSALDKEALNGLNKNSV